MLSWRLQNKTRLRAWLRLDVSVFDVIQKPHSPPPKKKEQNVERYIIVKKYFFWAKNIYIYKRTSLWTPSTKKKTDPENLRVPKWDAPTLSHTLWTHWGGFRRSRPLAEGPGSGREISLGCQKSQWSDCFFICVFSCWGFFLFEPVTK